MAERIIWADVMEVPPMDLVAEAWDCGMTVEQLSADVASTIATRLGRALSAEQIAQIRHDLDVAAEAVEEMLDEA